MEPYEDNTMKILKISAVIAIIESICMIPLDIASLQYSEMINSIPLFQNNGTSLNFLLSGSTIDNHEFLEAYNVFYSASMKILHADFRNMNAVPTLNIEVAI